MARLLVECGKESFEQELKKAVWTAGRRADADLVLVTPSASRDHFRLGRLKDGGWGLVDLGSTNSTEVNGQRVKQVRLKDGDVIRIGRDCTIRFVDDGPAEIDIADEAMLDKILADEGGLAAHVARGDVVRFHGYRLERRLSHGGMGIVFKARDRRGASVALKVLRRDKMDERSVALLKQEAWTISAFDHPGIVKVRDLSSHAGMVYIAMDFVDGQDLLQVGLRRELTFWQIADVIEQAADALKTVHARNIWHCDIKPQNLLLDREDRVRLIDFGIAAAERELDTSDNGGLVLGTPAFLAPEQVGRRGAVDARTDLYSLGAVLYYLLTGRRPFSGKTATEVVRNNLSSPPPHPHEVDDMIPDGLVDVCMRLLEKRPEDRYQSAEDLLAAIAAWRKSPCGREEKERHGKIMKLRAKKAKGRR